jgi:class 3 adenylate cyclase
MTETAPEGEGKHDEEWLEAVAERLGHGVPSTRTAIRARRRRLLQALSARARRERDDALGADLRAWLELAGLDVSEWDDTLRELATMVDRGETVGLDRESLPHVVQAYVRAVGRITAVEAAIAFTALRSVDPGRRAETIGQLIDAILPVSASGFDLLHRVMLQDALFEGSDGLAGDDSELENLAVGMVDLVHSTDHLSTAGAEDLERLVDAIFTAGQRATSGRPAHIVKYVGDGVFIASNDVGSVADAALEMIARLESELPLRARGGISYGFVVQRAGDIFGLPVNTSQALTKAARPGTVLLAAEAAAMIPASRRGRLRLKRLPHAALGEQRVATLRSAD